jgi:hypothetical protein
MTPARKAALRKAQLASARKRRRRAITIGVGGLAITGAVVRHKKSGSVLKVQRTSGRSQITGHHLPGGRRGYVTNSMVNTNRKNPYREITVASRSGTKRGVGVLGAITHRSPSLGKRTVVTYQHRKMILGHKTKGKVSLHSNHDNIPYYDPYKPRGYGNLRPTKTRIDMYENESKRYPILGDNKRDRRGFKI